MTDTNYIKDNNDNIENLKLNKTDLEVLNNNILFFPIEFLNNFHLENRTFTELISNILFTILTSLFFLVLFQVFIPSTTRIFLEVGDLFKATSFAGFIIVPISLFVINYLNTKIKFLENFGFNLILFIWIFGTLLFV